MTDNTELKEDIAAIRKWSRVQGLVALREIINELKPSDLVIYNEADGETTVREIAKKAGVSTGTVSHRMNDWKKIGVIEKDGQQWKHLASLEEMGIEEPEIETD